MYTGQIGVQSYLKRMAPDNAGINLSDLLAKPLHSTHRQDRVTIDSYFAQDKGELSEDMSAHKTIQSFGAVTYTRLTPNEKLRAFTQNHFQSGRKI